MACIKSVLINLNVNLNLVYKSVHHVVDLLIGKVSGTGPQKNKLPEERGPRNFISFKHNRFSIFNLINCWKLSDSTSVSRFADQRNELVNITPGKDYGLRANSLGCLQRDLQIKKKN